MKKFVPFLISSVFFISCNFSRQHKDLNTVQGDSIQIKIFEINDGYGYEIFLHQEKVVYQPTVPVVEGNINFSNQEFARETALLVSSKIRAGVIPPSLSSDEMEALFKQHN